MKNFIDNQEGSTAIEYGLIVSQIAILLIIASAFFGLN